MARTKIVFTEEQNFRIAQLIEVNKSLEEIVLEMEQTFNIKVSRNTLRSHIKTLGLARTDCRANNKRVFKYDLDRNDIIRLKAEDKSDGEIAKILNSTTKGVKAVCKRENITYMDIKQFKDDVFFNRFETIDLRTMKSDVQKTFLDELVNSVGDRTKIVTNVSIEYNGRFLLVDAFCPELNRAYVCLTIDDLISKNKKDRVGMVDIGKWANYVNKGCNIGVETKAKRIKTKTYEEGFEDYDDIISYNVNYVPESKIYTYDGLYLSPFRMIANWEERVYEVRTTARKIANEILILLERGTKIVPVLNDDFAYETRVQKSEMQIRVDEFWEMVNQAAMKKVKNDKLSRGDKRRK